MDFPPFVIHSRLPRRCANEDARLRQEEKREKPVEMRFSLPDPWSRHPVHRAVPAVWPAAVMFSRMRRQSVVVRGPETFLNKVLWPEFQEIDAALTEYLARSPGDADEVPEQTKIAK